MGVYNNNKDGTRSTLANTIQVVDAPMEQFVSRGEFSAVTPSDVSADNKLVAENEVTKAVDTMPTASASLVGTIVQYVGTTTANYTNGYFYKCVSDGAITPTYSWVEVISGGGGADLPWVTPQDYGAVGDGVTDDTTAIQSAFNAVRTNGGAVYFPKGTYIVSATIRIYSNTTVLGDKGQAIIKVIDSISSPIAVTAIGDTNAPVSNIVVKGLVFRGTETYGTAQGGVCLMDIINGTNISITDCLFQNNMYAAIRLIRNTSNVRVFSCRFEACDMGIASLGGVAVSDVTVRNCHFTGVSSLNSFTNVNSEQVGTFTNPEGGVSYRWVVEDCVFEYKTTNAIAFNIYNPPSDNTVYIKDCVVRNCTFRYIMGGVYVYHSENVSIDGLFFDDTPDRETSLGFLPYRLFHIERSNHITVRNVTSYSKQIRNPIQVRYSSDILIDGVDGYVDTLESPSDLPFAQLTNSSKIVARNFHFNPIGNDKVRAIIQMSTLTDSYIDLHGDIKNGSEVYLYAPSPDTLSGNIFVIDNDGIVRRNFNTYPTTVADTNTYRFVGTTPYSKKNISDIDKYYIYRRWSIGIDTQGNYDTSLAVTNFTLLNDGAELLLEFKSTSYTNGKTFTFNKTGNIIPIDQPFTFSNDYKVVCHFVQKNAKWVEVERTLEYYEGANVDVNNMIKSVYDPNGVVENAGGIVDYVGSIGGGIPHYTTMPSDATLLAMANKTVFETDGFWSQGDGHGGKYLITTDAYFTGGMLRITDGTTTKYLLALDNNTNWYRIYVDPTRYGVRGIRNLNVTLTLDNTYATQNSDIMSRITNMDMNATVRFPKGYYVFENPLNFTTRQYNVVGEGYPVTRTAALSLSDYTMGTTLCFPFLTNGQTAISMAGNSNIENLAIYGNKNTYNFVIDRTVLTTAPQSVITETIAESEGTQIKCKALNKDGGGSIKNVFVFCFYTGVTCSGNTFIKDFYARQVHYGINCSNDTKMEGIGGFNVHTLIRIRGSLCSVLHERVDSCVHALEIVNGSGHTITDVDGDWCTDSLIAIGDGTTAGTVAGVVFDGIHGRCNTLKSYDTTQQTDPLDVRELANIDGYGVIRVYANASFSNSRIVANGHGGSNPVDGTSTYLTPDILFTFSSRSNDVLDNITFVLAKGIYNIDDILRVIQTRSGFSAKVDDSSGTYFIEGTTVKDSVDPSTNIDFATLLGGE